MPRALQIGWWLLVLALLWPQGARGSDDPQRVLEIQVELAWLADPLVCPYYPCARVEGNHLEVDGYVPNEALRQKALQIARATCRLPVVDQLKVHPGLAVQQLPAPTEQVISAAAVALRQDFPDDHQQFLLNCLDQGRMLVSGTVRTYEHKLKLSQCLRRLRGVSHVINMAQVAGTQTTTLGHPTPWSPSKEILAPPSSVRPATPVPVVAPPVVEVDPAGPQTRLSPAIQPLPPPAPAKEGGTHTVVRRVGGTPLPKPPSHPEIVIQPPLPLPPAVPPELGRLARITSAQPAPAAAAIPVPPQKAENATSRVEFAAATLPSQETSRWITRQDMAMPLKQRPGAGSLAAPPARAPGETYVSEGVVQPGTTERPATTLARPQPLNTVQMLEQRLQRVCGSYASQVGLQVIGPNRVRVRVVTSNNQAADYLAGVILGLPELAPYQIDLAMMVSQ